MKNLTEREFPRTENEVLQSVIFPSSAIFLFVYPIVCECGRPSNLIVHRDGKGRCSCCDEKYLQEHHPC